LKERDIVWGQSKELGPEESIYGIGKLENKIVEEDNNISLTVRRLRRDLKPLWRL